MLGGCSGGVSAVSTTSGVVADTSQAYRVTHNKARSGIQCRRCTMIFCTEGSVWRTIISKVTSKDHCSSIGSPATKLQLFFYVNVKVAGSAVQGHPGGALRPSLPPRDKRSALSSCWV